MPMVETVETVETAEQLCADVVMAVFTLCMYLQRIYTYLQPLFLRYVYFVSYSR